METTILYIYILRLPLKKSLQGKGSTAEIESLVSVQSVPLQKALFLYVGVNNLKESDRSYYLQLWTCKSNCVARVPAL